MNIRQRINDELRRRRMRPADLARLVSGRVKARTLYDFLNGKRKGTGYVYPPINSDALGHVLDVLGLDIGNAMAGNAPPADSEDVVLLLNAFEEREQQVLIQEKRLLALKRELWHLSSALARRAKRLCSGIGAEMERIGIKDQFEYYVHYVDNGRKPTPTPYKEAWSIREIAAFAREMKAEWCDLRKRG